MDTSKKEIKQPSNQLDRFGKFQVINEVDPRHNSTSHKLYKTCEAVIAKMADDAQSDATTMNDKSIFVKTFLKFRKELFTDPHFLLKCIQNMPKKELQVFYMLSEKYKLDLLNKKVDKSTAFD